VKGSRDLLLECWDPIHISGTVKLETSNLAHRLATGGPNEKKNAKLGQKVSEEVTWPTFRILGPPPYLGNGWS